MPKQYEKFNLERALAGEPVILRDGRKAYVRHYEKTLTLRQDGRPLLGYKLYDGRAVEASWGPDGLWLRGREFPKDIVGMYPKHRLVYWDKTMCNTYRKIRTRKENKKMNFFEAPVVVSRVFL